MSVQPADREDPLDPQRILDELHESERAYFGFSVAISGSTTVVGVYEKNVPTGAAYAFANV